MTPQRACVIIGLAAAMLAPQRSSSQSELDVIYLKSGGKIVGRILEKSEGQAVRVELQSGEVLFVPWGNIRTMEEAGRTSSEPLPPVPAAVLNSSGQSLSLWGISIAGGMSKCVSLDDTPLGISSAIGVHYNLSPSFSQSVGIKTDLIRNMDLLRKAGTLVLIYTSFRYRTDPRSVLSVYGSLGGGFATGAGYETEVSLFLDAGFATPVSETVNIFFEGATTIILMPGGWIPGEAYVLVRLGSRIEL